MKNLFVDFAQRKFHSGAGHGSPQQSLFNGGRQNQISPINETENTIVEFEEKRPKKKLKNVNKKVARRSSSAASGTRPNIRVSYDL